MKSKQNNIFGMIAVSVFLIGSMILTITACVSTPSTSPETLPPSEEEQASSTGTFQFTEENFPRIDGSTATIPLIEAVTSVLLKKPRSEIDVSVRKTSGAYVALAENEADILLVYDGGDETRRQVNADERFETMPIGKDALVFLVNRDNPVDGLSTQQAQMIFSGEYTNWNEVGGRDEEIRAYQRGIGSGSQALMDKLVMDGLDMANPAMVPVVESMGGLIDVVADFSGGPAGIGYNVYYYVTEMRGNDYIKILSIDGIEPTYDTIQSGEYPLVSEFYSVIRKDEPEGSPARALHEWMLTDEAQNLMVSENYVALHANPTTDTPYIGGKFSFYPDGEEPAYFQGTNPYVFEARDDYGQLYFYLGGLREGVREDEWADARFYGLCTAHGELVTEPIYTTPQLLTDSGGSKAYFCHRSDLEPVGGTYPVLLFATDGSWIKEFDGARLFYGFTGVIDDVRNADVLAVTVGGKWGAVNMKGETVIPFERDSYRGIYPEPDGGEGMLSVTGDRFMRGVYSEDGATLNDLYDGNSNLIATGLYGMPRGMSGDFIVTIEWGESGAFYTYTLDGELIASRDFDADGYGDAEAFGDYVRIYAEKSTIICDMELNTVSEFPNTYEEGRYTNPYMTGPNVLCVTDRQAFYHRTYLPDGTRLVTFYDPVIGD